MIFPIAFGATASTTPPSTTATTYGGLDRFGFSVTAETGTQVPLSEACSITELGARVATAPGAGTSWTFTVRKNGADTGATITISGTATSALWTGTLSLAAGDLITIAAVPGSTPAATGDMSGHVLFSTTGNTFFLFAKTANASATATQYGQIARNGSFSATESDVELVVPMAATLTKMAAITATSPPGTAASGKSYAISVRHNATDVLTGTIADAATAAAIQTGSEALVAGDVLTLKCVPTGTPTARAIGVCLSLTPANTGESIVAMSSVSAASTATSYNNPFGPGTTWGASEGGRQVPQDLALVLRSMRVKLNTAPGTGTSRTVTLRNAGTDTTLTVTVSDTATTAAVTPGSPVTLSGANAVAALKNAVSGAPVGSIVHVGYVLYTDQSGGTPPPPAPMDVTDIKWRLTGGATNTSPGASLGGAPGALMNTGPGADFDDVSGAEAAAGDVEYRCRVLKNEHPTDTLSSVSVWIAQDSSSPDTTIAIGRDPAAVSVNPQTVANEGVAPTGVTFSSPNVGSPLALPDLPAGAFVAIWERRTVTAGAAVVTTDTWQLAWQGNPPS